MQQLLRNLFYFKQTASAIPGVIHGQEVAQGQVDGEPVALPPGNYRVRVGLVPELMLEEAQVVSGQTTAVEMD